MPRLPNTRSFRVQGKNFFLTYARCPLEKHILIEFFKSSNPQPAVYMIKVAQEHHEDGGTHHQYYYCLLQFDKKLDIRDARKWDISVGTHTYQPNIEVAKKVQDVINFIDKEGTDIVEEGITFKQPPFTVSMNSKNEIWSAISNSSTSAADFLHKCKLLQPATFRKKSASLQHAANRIWPPKPDVFDPPYLDFPNLPDTLHSWMIKNVCCSSLRRPHRPMSLILEGGSGLGKTQWARSIAPHNYFTGRMDFRSYSNDARYNVIDNIEFRHCKEKKMLLGGKHDWTADVKYGKPIRITGGIPTIVLCNPDMSWNKKMSDSFREWFNCNAQYEYLYTSLF